MIIINKKDKIKFDWLNMIDFQLVGFALIEIKETSEEKYISWIKDDPNDYLYKYFHIAALRIILKYNILSMRMS